MIEQHEVTNPATAHRMTFLKAQGRKSSHPEAALTVKQVHMLLDLAADVPRALSY